MFGREATEILDYVECFPNGYVKGIKIAKACVDVNIEWFPTWVINGKGLYAAWKVECKQLEPTIGSGMFLTEVVAYDQSSEKASVDENIDNDGARHDNKAAQWKQGLSQIGSKTEENETVPPIVDANSSLIAGSHSTTPRGWHYHIFRSL